MKNKMKLGRLFGVVLAGMLLLSATACKKEKTEETVQDTSVVEQAESQAIDNTIEWKGKAYQYNTNLKNILFLGIDQSEEMEDSYIPGDAGQTDCIMLLSMDETTKQASILQINRNTMTELDVYDFSGNYQKSVDGQIALQYAYSIGGESSNWAVKKTVGELLYGLQIDGCFAMNMGIIPELNDAIGGVDVTAREDYTEIDPGLTKGSTVHLGGELAERFVRYRDTEEFNSVEDRMHRQTDYITAMITAMRKSGGQKLYDIVSPYLDTNIVTDLSADQIDALTSYEYLTDDVAYLPGEMRMGEIYEEYYIQEEELQDLLIQMFYEEVQQ